jgi:hypothetical protein
MLRQQGESEQLRYICGAAAAELATPHPQRAPTFQSQQHSLLSFDSVSVSCLCVGGGDDDVSRSLPLLLISTSQM